MVEAIKEEATKNWPLLLLVLLMTGGGTSLGNLVFGGGDSDSGDYSFATNEAGADADFSAPSKGSPGRKALRQFMGKKVTPKNIRLTERELRMGMATATTFAIRRPAETNYVHFLNLKADYEESLTP